MIAPTFIRLTFLATLLAAFSGFAAEVKTPVVTDSRLDLTLVAAEPDIVTPIGLTIDKRGRLFVVESHTHFPPTNYPGPKYDRVKLFQDTNGDGKPDKISVFAEGLHHTMNLAFSPEGHLYAVHRNGVLRLDDKDGDGISESRATILQMETPGNYPHNGLGGITFSPDGWLYVGQGENLGERYTLKGSDGSSRSGKGEGGNVFRCRPDGSQLQLVATGFWNPFGLAFYGKEFLLAVDNDPDSRPPNRLLDVVMHGDYGFKFRFGRNGLHPFQAWNGELSGTLPMVAGTGEGACAILPCAQTRLPASYREAILVTASWDHQVEVFDPKPFGASLRADREVLIRGDESFRPVALAAAPDGSVFFTDWVDVSYNVHGEGRIWRLTPKPETNAKPAPVLKLAANAERKQMHRLLDAQSLKELPDLLAGLSEQDPFVRSAAISSLSKPVYRAAVEKELQSKSAAVRLGALLALRRAAIENPAAILEKLLIDPDENVRLMAVIWAGEQSLVQLTNRLDLVLSAGPVSATLLRAHTAASQILAKAAGRGQQDLPAGEAGKSMLFDLATRTDEQPFIGTLKAAPAKTPLDVRLEAVRSLAQTANPQAVALLEQTAMDRNNPAELRSEAIVALAGASANSAILLPLLNDSSLDVRIEAVRALRALASQARVRAALEQKMEELRESGRDAEFLEQIVFTLQVSGASLERTPPRPASDEEWRQALLTPGDAASGRRVFFYPALGCAKCHRVEDHGGHIGPDLSTIARGANQEKLIQSILHPSRDIAPQFVSHTVETRDGQVFTGLLIGQSSDAGITLFTAEGKAVLIPPGQVASHSQSKTSLMPEGLEQALSVRDFRDLLAFLLSRK